MATTSTGIVYSNSGAAASDTYTLTEDSLFSVALDVMANDGGGAKTTLYSIDDGVANSGTTTTGGVSINTDLLTKDDVGAVGYSALGAKIKINADRTIQYDASSFAGTFQSLAAGEVVTDTFTYAIKMSNGTLAWTTVSVKIAGVNDKPTVAGALCTSAVEDGNKITLDLLSGSSDKDHGAQLHVELTDSLPAGVSLNGQSLTINPSHSAFQHLAAGAKDTIIVHYHVVDEKGGFAEQTATFHITGVNDKALIAGADTGAITEDSGDYTASGTLTVSDADDGENKAKASTQSNAYGTFSVDTDGHWTFSANNDALQSLGEDVTKTLTFSIDSKDGTGHHDVSIDLVGINDLATVAGTDSTSITEDSDDYVASGTLTVSDADDGESKAKASTESNAYGTFSVDTDGHWTFTANNNALQALGDDITETLTFSVDSKDGSGHHDVSIDLVGVNDLATVAGTDNASITEDSDDDVASGTLTISDADDGESKAKAATQSNAYGTFSVDADGNWTFTANNDALQSLGEDVTKTLTFSVDSKDGSGHHDVSIDLVGINDLATVAGDDNASITEDSDDDVASGTLTVADADDGEDKAKASTESNAYGTFSVDADGHWTFTANNDALQSLGEDVTKTLTLSVDSKDGTGHHDVSIDLVGINDLATIAGDDGASVTEDSGSYTVQGSLTVSDADDGESKAKASTQSNAYGTFSVDADGHWTFTANNDALQSLGEDVTKTLTFNVDSKDGTGHHDVSIDLIGVDDDASIAGTDSASITEDSSDYVASGTLTISDADDGESKAKTSTQSNAYGTFSVDTDGHWTFTANNDALQSLGEDVSKTLTFSVDSKDGSGHHDVSIDLIGVNDLAIIGGGDNASITEDSGAYEITGALSVNDLDQDESSFNAVTDFHSSYGTFSIDADGNWTYVLDNDNTDVAALDNTETLQDTIIVTSADGTEKDILITINGHTDLVAASLPATSSAGNDPNDKDTLTGGALITANNQTSNGADVGHGDANSQVLSLGGGNDVYYAGAGDDKITGDNGTDTIYGQQGTDTVSGNNQVDVLYGGSGNDIIDGGSGNDILYGGSGNDTIGGSADNDTIIGGYGADVLTGDTGADTFVFLNLLDTNDTINDFQVGIDKLDLQAIYSGTLSFDSGHAGSGAVNANSVSFFAKDGNTTVIVDTDGNTATAEFAIKLTGSLSLTATDFLL
jgi:VCBS repeat-containing protein